MQGYLVQLGNDQLGTGDQIVDPVVEFNSSSNLGAGSWIWTGVWDGDGNTYNNINDTGVFHLGQDGNVYFVPDTWTVRDISSATVNALPAYDQIETGTTGNETVIAGAEDDTVYGGASGATNNTGNDTLDGGAGDDAIFGGDGNDEIIGSGGNDTIDAGSGNDVVYGDNDTTVAATSESLNWTAQGANDTDISPGFTQNTGEMSVSVGFQTFAGNTFVQASTDGQWVGTDSINNASSVNIYGAGGDNTTTSLIFNANDGSGMTDEVEDVFFFINDIDTLAGQFVDTITVTAFDYDGNEVAVSVTALGDDQVNGQTVSGVGASQDEPNLENGSARVSIDGPVHTVKIEYINTVANGNQQIFFTDVHFTTIPDSSANDSILGGAGEDLIYGGAGNDSIDGQSENDTIFGGSGNDSIDAGLGNDSVAGGDGDDIINSNNGDDTVEGNAGNDDLFLGTGEDVAYGGIGNDSIDGGDDNDSIEGGSGDDEIDGGLGNDDIFGNDGNDSIQANTGDDTVEGNAGNDDIHLGTGNDIGYGGTGNDTIAGEAGNDFVSGDDGADLVYGGAGNDIVDGGAGDDSVYGGSGSDDHIVDIDQGSDVIIGGEDSGNTDVDVLTLNNSSTADGVTVAKTGAESGTYSYGGGQGDGSFVEIENVVTTDNADTATGSSGADFFTLNGGADVVDAGAGDDIVNLGASDGAQDTVVFSAGDGSDVVYEFEVPTDNGDGTFTGQDLFDVTGMLTISGDQVTTADVVVVANIDGDAVLMFPNGESVTLIGVAPSAVSSKAQLFAMGVPQDGTVEGTSGDDTIDSTYTGDPDSDMVDNNDAVLPGDTGNDDLVYAYGGDDRVSSGDGNDEVYGGAGNDIIHSTSGDNTLTGGDGDDRLQVSQGTNTLIGDAGNDTFYGGSGSDTFYGGTGDDTITGSIGSDEVYGGAGNDSISAGGFAGAGDIMFGEAGNDTITGGAGDDTAFGGDGDDVYRATVDGTDTVTGGETGETNGDTLDASIAFDDLTLDLTAVDATDNESGTVTNGVGTTTFTDIENVVLGAGDDSVIGSQGDDVVDTGAGADTIDGGTGNDTINVGDQDGDADLIRFSDNDGQDTIVGFDAPTDDGDGTFTGIDQLDVSGLTDLGGDPVNTHDVTVTDDGSGNAVLNFPNGESLTFIGLDPAFASQPQVLIAMGIPAPDGTVSGTSGNDLIDTNYLGDPDGDRVDSNDAILPGDTGNDDLIEAGAGNDTVIAGDGDDSIFAGSGDDTIFAGAGNDSIDMGSGSNVIYAGDGDDTVSGASSMADSTIYGGAGNDTLETPADTSDDHTIYGGAGNDFIRDNGDENTEDLLDGGSGDDEIIGGEGNDTIIGGTGDDVVEGGAGDDTFILEDGFGVDTIAGSEFTETTGDVLDATAMTQDAVLTFAEVAALPPL